MKSPDYSLCDVSFRWSKTTPVINWYVILSLVILQRGDSTCPTRAKSIFEKSRLSFYSHKMLCPESLPQSSCLVQHSTYRMFPSVVAYYPCRSSQSFIPWKSYVDNCIANFCLVNGYRILKQNLGINNAQICLPPFCYSRPKIPNMPRNCPRRCTFKKCP